MVSSQKPCVAVRQGAESALAAVVGEYSPGRSRVVIPCPAAPALGLVFTCGSPDCGHIFEPDAVAFTAARLACPRCGGCSFGADLVEPPAQRESGEQAVVIPAAGGDGLDAGMSWDEPIPYVLTRPARGVES